MSDIFSNGVSGGNGNGSGNGEDEGGIFEVLLGAALFSAAVYAAITYCYRMQFSSKKEVRGNT